MRTRNKPSKQKLLSTFIASVFCSTAVYAVDYTDTVQIPTHGTVTLNSGDTVSTQDKNAIEIFEASGSPPVSDPSGVLNTDGATISVTGTDSNTAGIHVDASGATVLNIVNTQITNESGWGMILENTNGGTLEFSGADTLLQGGAGAIKFDAGAGSIITKFKDYARIEGDIQVSDNPLSPMEPIPALYLQDHASWTGDLNSDGRFMLSITESSTWHGDTNITSSINPNKIGRLMVNLDDSHKTGNTQIHSDNQFFGSIQANNQSSWQGDVDITDRAVSSIYSFYASNKSTWQGNLNVSLTTPSISAPITADPTAIGVLVSEESKWEGDVSVTSDDDANYGKVNFVVSDNSLFDGSVNVSGKNSFGGLAANSSWQGDISANLISDATKQNEFTLSLLDGSRTGKTDISAENGKAAIILFGASTWNGDINITGANQNAGDKMIYLASKSTLNSAVNADTTAMLLTNSTWNMSGNSVLESIDIQAAAKINFAANTKNKAGGFHTLTVGDLTSDGSGSIHMRTDLANLTGDRLNITNAVTGDVNIHINNQGGAYVNPSKELTIIDSNGYQDHFHLANEVEVGGYKYNMRADGAKLNLFTTNQLTSSAEASVNAMSAGYLIRYAENQTLLQRMGDLRQDERVSNDVWTRAYSGEFNVDDGNRLSGYDLDYSGVQIGADRQFNLASGKAYVGAMAGFTKGKQKHQQGSGTIDSTSIGAYGTYVHNNGIYVDTLLRYVHMNHDYDVRDSAGAGVNGSGSTDGYAASLALGKRFYLEQPKEGWYLEPEAQISTSYQNGTSITSSNGLRTDIDGYQSTQAQAGLRLGHELNSAKQPFNVYVKTAYVQELEGKVDYRLNNLGEKEQFGNNWWTVGAGVTTTLNKQHNLYFDVERSDGATFKHPWQVNLGYRFGF